jgi:hypothetical protein
MKGCFYLNIPNASTIRENQDSSDSDGKPKQRNPVDVGLRLMRLRPERLKLLLDSVQLLIDRRNSLFQI